MGVLGHIGLFTLLRSKVGEVNPNPPADPPPNTTTAGNTFTQDDVNNIVKRETAKVLEKFGDYNDLVKFKQEQMTAAQQREEQDLEKKQEYEKLKEGWSKTEQEYKSKIDQANAALTNERIGNALTNEVFKNGGFPDAAKLVREHARLTDDGKIVIHGKNEQGVETDLSVEEGVKQFLKERPYLVKDSSQAGGGTPPNNGGAGQSNSNPTGDLGDQLMNARMRGDVKEVNRIKSEIRAKHSNRPAVF